MNSYFYSNTISNFLTSSTNENLALLPATVIFRMNQQQKGAWIHEINTLKNVLKNHEGISFPHFAKEISIPFFNPYQWLLPLTIATIAGKIWYRLSGKEYSQNDAVCRGLS